MFRDPLSIINGPARPASAGPVVMAAPRFGKGDVPLWPSGIVRFDDGILEITLGEGLRIAARDVEEIELAPALGARLMLCLTYRNGFDVLQRRFWVAVDDHDALARLVATVRRALTARATAA